MAGDAKPIGGIACAARSRCARHRYSGMSRHVTARCAGGGIAFGGVQCGTEVASDGEAHIVRYRSSEWAERGFCGRCGNSLFYHYLPLSTHAFASGLFPDDASLPLAEEIFIDEKPVYYAFDADSAKLTAAEVKAKYGIG